MEAGNTTLISEFILLGFPELHGMKMMIFTVILLLYLISVSGNCLILTVVFLEPKLHMPMYFFLSSFSMGEFCGTTVVVPKMLTNILLDQNTICFACCMAQCFVTFFTGAVQFINLTVMSFDRYTAICKPFLYNNMMTNGLCLHLTLLAWVGGFTVIFCQSVLVWTYPYCGSNIIDHFFCDIGPVLKVACVDTTLVELIGLFYGIVVMWGSFLSSLVSYACIIYTIIQIPSVTGRSKAFSTCSSHLTVVCIFYSAMFVMYLKPSTQTDSHINKVVYLVTIVILPALSPFIFTLRNKDFQAALHKVMDRRKHNPFSFATKFLKHCSSQSQCLDLH